MRRNTTTPLLKNCITQSLLLLLRKKSLDEISVKEIVEKAGVNRSTYYRHFVSKHEIIRHFFADILDEYLLELPEEIDVEAYFTGMFRRFLNYKDILILLERLSLSYLLLEELNDRIRPLFGNQMDAVENLYCHYHLGGVFNSFRLWVHENMQTSPEILARQCMMILPDDFSPRLLHFQQRKVQMMDKF